MDSSDKLCKALLEVCKFGGKIFVMRSASMTIVVTSGLSAPLIGASLYVSGKVLEQRGKMDGNKFVESVGNFIKDVGFATLTGGVLGTVSNSLFSRGTKIIGSQAARKISGHEGKITEIAKYLINAGKGVSYVQKGYEISQIIKICGEGYYRFIMVLEGKTMP